LTTVTSRSPSQKYVVTLVPPFVVGTAPAKESFRDAPQGQARKP
jgi:hypothetical protein